MLKPAEQMAGPLWTLAGAMNPTNAMTSAATVISETWLIGAMSTLD